MESVKHPVILASFAEGEYEVVIPALEGKLSAFFGVKVREQCTHSWYKPKPVSLTLSHHRLSPVCLVVWCLIESLCSQHCNQVPRTHAHPITTTSAHTNARTRTHIHPHTERRTHAHTLAHAHTVTVQLMQAGPDTVVVEHLFHECPAEKAGLQVQCARACALCFMQGKHHVRALLALFDISLKF